MKKLVPFNPAQLSTWAQAMQLVSLINGSQLFQSAGVSIIPQVLTYPLFGESIGKNFLVDAFSLSAAIDYPSAYEVSQSSGDYDPWLPGL